MLGTAGKTGATSAQHSGSYPNPRTRFRKPDLVARVHRCLQGHGPGPWWGPHPRVPATGRKVTHLTTSPGTLRIALPDPLCPLCCWCSRGGHGLQHTNRRSGCAPKADRPACRDPARNTQAGPDFYHIIISALALDRLIAQLPSRAAANQSPQRVRAPTVDRPPCRDPATQIKPCPRLQGTGPDVLSCSGAQGELGRALRLLATAHECVAGAPGVEPGCLGGCTAHCSDGDMVCQGARGARCMLQWVVERVCPTPHSGSVPWKMGQACVCGAAGWA